MKELDITKPQGEAIPLRVLIVEDREDDCLLVIRELRRGGFAPDFRRVQTADEMAAALDREAWQVIVCDYRLPQFSAIDALELARARELDIPFIVVSGTIGEETAAETMRRGAHDYVMKARLERLAPAIVRELGEAAGRRQRREMERRLRESETQFRSLLNSVRDAVWAASADGSDFRYLSPAIETIYGRPREEFVANPRLWLEAVHPEDRERVEGHTQRLAEEGAVDDIYRILRPDGTVRWLHDHKALVTDDRGTPVQMGGLARDITPVMEAEAALRASERRFRGLFEGASQGILVADSDTRRFRLANPAICRLLGYSEAELTSMRVDDIHPADSLSETLALFAALAQGTQGRANDIACLRKDGQIIRVDIHTASIDLDGRPCQAGFFTDVTEQHAQQEELRRLGAAIEQTGESVLITDPEGIILYVNPAFTRSSGYAPEEVIGQTPRLLRSGKTPEAVYAEIWSTIAAGKTWQGRLIDQRRDGSLFTQDAVISPVHDGAGKIVNLVGVMRDVSHELALQEQLRQAQKMEAVGRLAGGVAHDFNNLLTVILGQAQLVLMKLRPDDPLRKRMEDIVTCSDRATGLTRQLLAFSRKQNLQPVVLDLNELIRNLQRMLARLIGEDVKMQVVAHASPGTVRADPGQLEQVIMNLVINARDAMPNGGKLIVETANVTLDATESGRRLDVPPGAYVQLTVTDNGHGMDKSILEHIFEPFFTTKEEGKGTGLGLSTAYGIVKQSGGDIRVYSEVDVGTSFTVYLPQVTAAIAGLQARPAVRMSRGSGEAILLVEDDDRVREIVAVLLQDLGYMVTAAADSAEAVNLVEEGGQQPRLLLTDVVLAGMNGVLLARKLQAKLPGLRVLYMSGYTDTAAASLDLVGPDTGYMQKPFSLVDLASKVRSVLDSEPRN